MNQSCQKKSYESRAPRETDRISLQDTHEHHSRILPVVQTPAAEGGGHSAKPAGTVAPSKHCSISPRLPTAPMTQKSLVRSPAGRRRRARGRWTRTTPHPRAPPPPVLPAAAPSSSPLPLLDRRLSRQGAPPASRGCSSSDPRAPRRARRAGSWLPMPLSLPAALLPAPTRLLG